MSPFFKFLNWVFFFFFWIDICKADSTEKSSNVTNALLNRQTFSPSVNQTITFNKSINFSNKCFLFTFKLNSSFIGLGTNELTMNKTVFTVKNNQGIIVLTKRL